MQMNAFSWRCLTFRVNSHSTCKETGHRWLKVLQGHSKIFKEEQGICVLMHQIKHKRQLDLVTQHKQSYIGFPLFQKLSGCSPTYHSQHCKVQKNVALSPTSFVSTILGAKICYPSQSCWHNPLGEIEEKDYLKQIGWRKTLFSASGFLAHLPIRGSCPVPARRKRPEFAKAKEFTNPFTAKP